MTGKIAGVFVLGFVAATAQAQTNIEKLKQMKVATTDLNIPVVPQTGKNADAIRENLKRIKLPPGFKIDLFAIVPDARHMAVAPSTNDTIALARSSRNDFALCCAACATTGR